MESGWYRGDIFPFRKILIIASIVSLIIFPASYILINRPNTSVSTLKGPSSNTILFACGSNPCLAPEAIYTVNNGSPSLNELVNVTYTCNCTAIVNFYYSPDTFNYHNGTLVPSEHIIPPATDMTILAQATRTNGTGIVLYVNIRTSP